MFLSRLEEIQNPAKASKKPNLFGARLDECVDAVGEGGKVDMWVYLYMYISFLTKT